MRKAVLIEAAKEFFERVNIQIIVNCFSSLHQEQKNKNKILHLSHNKPYGPPL